MIHLLAISALKGGTTHATVAHTAVAPGTAGSCAVYDTVARYVTAQPVGTLRVRLPSRSAQRCCHSQAGQCAGLRLAVVNIGQCQCQCLRISADVVQHPGCQLRVQDRQPRESDPPLPPLSSPASPDRGQRIHGSGGAALRRQDPAGMLSCPTGLG
jgi:hypothetical protein